MQVDANEICQDDDCVRGLQWSGTRKGILRSDDFINPIMTLYRSSLMR